MARTAGCEAFRFVGPKAKNIMDRKKLMITQ